MIYLQEDPLVIRSMEEADVQRLYTAFQAIGYHTSRELLTGYWREHRDGKRTSVVFDWEGESAGYVTLLPTPDAGPFLGQSLPEVKDFNVLPAYRRRGIGGRAMQVVEDIAAKTGDFITLAVGLYTDYGSAQRMYVKRGYIPDGSGLWHRDKNLPPMEPCVNDDDLVLYFSKRLR